MFNVQNNIQYDNIQYNNSNYIRKNVNFGNFIKKQSNVLEKTPNKDSFFSKDKKITIGAFSVLVVIGLGVFLKKCDLKKFLNIINKFKFFKSPIKNIAQVKQQNNLISIADIELEKVKYPKKGIPSSAEYNKQAVEIIDECKDLTFDTPNLNLMRDFYDENHAYDLGIRFAAVANNTAAQKGSAEIINQVPEIFHGLDKKTIISTLDKLPSYIEKCESTGESTKITKFLIDNKTFRAQFIGCGAYGRVYKITDDFGHQICYKAFRSNTLRAHAPHGVYYEIGIAQEAHKAGVVDIPELFMANPLGKELVNGNMEGAWMLTEFIEKGKTVPKQGLKFENWLFYKNLIAKDLGPTNRIDEYIVDLGGVGCKNDIMYETFHKGTNLTDIFTAQQLGVPIEEIISNIKTT